MNIEIQRNVELANLTTIKIGGKAKFFAEVADESDLQEVLTWVKENQQKTLILGGGSNILFSDDGFDGLVLKIKNRQLEILPEDKSVIEKEDYFKVVCGAGVAFSELVNFSIKNQSADLIWASGIPGTVGGALVGNAGAFGGEMKDSVANVLTFEIDKISTLNLTLKEDCQFGYRDSFFKGNRNVAIWSAVLVFKKTKEKVEALLEKRNEIIQKRLEKQPSLRDFPSLGSVFKNPLGTKEAIFEFEKEKMIIAREGKLPAGWLIDKCDLKGFKIGGAMVSEKQANFIVNAGEATAENVIMLISLIKEKVRNRFGIQLAEEIVIAI